MEGRADTDRCATRPVPRARCLRPGDDGRPRRGRRLPEHRPPARRRGGRRDRGPLRHLRRLDVDDDRHRPAGRSPPLLQLGQSPTVPYDVRLTSPARRWARPFWETLSDRGRRIAVLDVPHADVPESFNGVLVKEWGCHDRHHGTGVVPARAPRRARRGSPAATRTAAAAPAGDEPVRAVRLHAPRRRPSHARRAAPAVRPDPRGRRGQARCVAAPPRSRAGGTCSSRWSASPTASATSSGTSTTRTTLATTRRRAASSVIPSSRSTSASTPSSASTPGAGRPGHRVLRPPVARDAVALRR